RALRSRSLAAELRTDLAHTRPEPPDPDGLVPIAPAPPTMTRRGALAMVGGGSLLLLVVTAGQSIGGWLRGTALLAPHNRTPGSGPNAFQINKTAASVGVTPARVGPAWRLEIHGPGPTLVLTRAQLLAMPQHAAALPIACVEGWSTPNQQWSGLRLADLAALAGLPDARSVLVLCGGISSGAATRTSPRPGTSGGTPPTASAPSRGTRETGFLPPALPNAVIRPRRNAPRH
ncbi:molybdopterin-dependent oxidoreductase, partial [Streptomyces sp. NPDC087568]